MTQFTCPLWFTSIIICCLFTGVLPGDQEVLVFEEQSLCDDVFMSPQPVQTALIDDVPHDHIRVLQEEEVMEGEDML